jgi:hypothetical protein
MITWTEHVARADHQVLKDDFHGVRSIGNADTHIHGSIRSFLKRRKKMQTNLRLDAYHLVRQDDVRRDIIRA